MYEKLKKKIFFYRKVYVCVMVQGKTIKILDQCHMNQCKSLKFCTEILQTFTN